MKKDPFLSDPINAAIVRVIRRFSFFSTLKGVRDNNAMHRQFTSSDIHTVFGVEWASISSRNSHN